ncbi:MAG TPA: DUF1232 domain-containing protein [Bacteroidetes bacterium]|nr:DUF1232 domain-containing protein [Bacteroidota bacterium]
MKPEKKLSAYSKYFNEKKLFKKLKSVSGAISANMLYYILVLFYLVSDKSVPFKTRMIFAAALGYLILPTDLVSDFIPGLGFTDDAALIAFAAGQAVNYVTPEIKAKSLNTLEKLVGCKAAEKVNKKDFFKAG